MSDFDEQEAVFANISGVIKLLIKLLLGTMPTFFSHWSSGVHLQWKIKSYATFGSKKKFWMWARKNLWKLKNSNLQLHRCEKSYLPIFRQFRTCWWYLNNIVIIAANFFISRIICVETIWYHFAISFYCTIAIRVGDTTEKKMYKAAQRILKRLRQSG